MIDKACTVIAPSVYSACVRSAAGSFSLTGIQYRDWDLTNIDAVDIVKRSLKPQIVWNVKSAAHPSASTLRPELKTTPLSSPATPHPTSPEHRRDGFTRQVMADLPTTNRTDQTTSSRAVKSFYNTAHVTLDQVIQTAA